MFPSIARFFALILLFAIFHISSEAQSSTPSSDTGTVSDHDRLLLEKIDRLERRIAELEARAGIEPATKQSDPSAATNGKMNQQTSQLAAETPAANSSAALAEAEAPFEFAELHMAKRQQPDKRISARVQGLHGGISRGRELHL